MNAFRNNKVDDVVGKLISFTIFPFFTFLYSLKDISSKASYIIFICFNLLFGLNFSVVYDPSAEHNLDGGYYRSVFERYCLGSDFDDRFLVFLQFNEENSKDIYVDLISYIVSLFTSNYHVLFFVYASVMTFFMANSLKYLLQSNNFKNGNLVCFFLFVMFILNDIFGINGVRFWTAAWISVYVLFKMFVDKKLIFFALLCITPLIHASFYIIIFVTILGYFLNGSAPILRKLLLFSIVIAPLFIIVVRSIDISSMPAFVSRYMDLYISEDAIQNANEKATSSLYYTISTIFRIVGLIYINLLILMIAKASKEHGIERKLTNFLVIFAIFCNLVQILPSGGRFFFILYPIVSYLWLNVKGIHEDAKWIVAFPFVFFIMLRAKITLYPLVLDNDFYYMNLISLISKNL